MSIDKKFTSKELKHFQDKLYLLSDDLLEHLVSRHIFWYRRHAEINKVMFRWGSVSVILINAVIAIVSFYAGSLLLTVLSVSAIAVRAVVDLYRCQENWKRYRTTLEKLLTEVDLYLAKTARYENNDFYANKKLLALRITEITGNEVEDWGKQREEEKSKWRQKI